MGFPAPKWVLVFLALPVLARAGDRFESFDRDPGWEGINNRSDHFAPRTIRQDFGYDPVGKAVGGTITPAAEPASYAKVIPDRTFGDRLTASGTLRFERGPGHLLIGFFNAGTLNEWRTPNTIALRILGRGDDFYAYVEYATSRWRAGGDSPRPFPRERVPGTVEERFRGFSSDETHRWSLSYDPAGNGGRGVVTATIDDATAVCELDDGHKQDGATFNRFGLLGVMKSADGPGAIRLDDVEILGEPRSTFDRDPGWEGRGNRVEFVSANVRPRFDFGFSPTHHAGGKAPGELGGLVFRGDCREPQRLASYGDRIGPLSSRQPLHASGTIALRRGVSDSTALLGFYHHERSLRVNPSQGSGWPESFLGFAVEGPSRDGFLIYPVVRTAEGRQAYARGASLPAILPDGRPHRWTLTHEPDGEHGRIVLVFDETPVTLDLSADMGEATFDRFGIVTTWIDGNAESIYFDDLSYTAEP